MEIVIKTTKDNFGIMFLCTELHVRTKFSFKIHYMKQLEDELMMEKKKTRLFSSFIDSH